MNWTVEVSISTCEKNIEQNIFLMNYLCDTNVISESMKRLPDPKVKQWLTNQELVYLSVITPEDCEIQLFNPFED